MKPNVPLWMINMLLSDTIRRSNQTISDQISNPWLFIIYVAAIVTSITALLIYIHNHR